MRFFSCFTLAVCLTLAAAGPARAQTTGSPLQAPLAVQYAIDSRPYTSSSPVTYTKTASGLQVALSPSALSGSSGFAGQQLGMVLEIPDFFIRMIFF